MNGRTLPRLARPLSGAVALVLLTALPGVAVASLPAHPAPTHACCVAPEAMPPGPCETAPCCITKPAPRTPSVTTSAPDAPALVATGFVADASADLSHLSRGSAAGKVPPRARSAPLFLLLVTFLN